MALHLNLYHEIQRQELQRRRDPLKIGVMVLLFIALGFIAWYFWRLEAVSSVKAEMTKLQADWGKAEPQQKDATALQEELNLNKQTVAALVRGIEGRFYWAPLLGQIFQVVPPEVQITRFDGNLAPEGPKKVSFTLSGIVAGNPAREVADHFRKVIQGKLSGKYQLEKEKEFKSLEDGTETVQYQGRNWPTALFAIDLSVMNPDASEAAKKEHQPGRTK